MKKRFVVFVLFDILACFGFLKMSNLKRANFSSRRVYDRNGILMREICSTKYGTAYPILIETLPGYFIDTVITVEDKRFYYHPGIDPVAVARAIFNNIKARKVTSGGSTITQQLIRNIYYYPRTVPYKILESLHAVCVELRYSKKRILEEYLNRIPYGNGAYGIESASRLYFAKPAKDLTLAESAFLCAIPASNKMFDPYRNFSLTLKRQKNILKTMYKKGKIGKSDYEISVKENLSLYPKERKFLAPHFCEWIIERYKSSNLECLETTLDSNLQKTVEYIVRNHLARLKTANVNNASVMVVDNFTGDILAFVGSPDYFDENNCGQVNGVLALRQPGSAVKPFVYGLAFENGFTAADTIPDLETGIKLENSGYFLPQNYDKKYHGLVRLRTALACSYNIATTNLAVYLGPDMILAKFRIAGLDSLKKDSHYYGAGLCLGNGEITLWEIVRAYSALANAGELKSLRALKNEPRISKGRVFNKEVAYMLTDILSDNNARTPAFGEFSPLNLPFKCASKTGTSKNFRDNWTLGYTRRYTVGVWVGNFSGKPMYSISGISGAGPIFRDIMLALEIGNKDIDFPVPEKIKKINICSKSGKLPLKYCAENLDEIFIEDNIPVKNCDIHRLCKIDARTGLPAEFACPDKFIEDKIYEVYPIQYYEWASNSGMDMPTSRQFIQAEQYVQGCGSVLPEIDSPSNGEIYKIDPVLRKEYQRVTLKPGVQEDVRSVKWLIDSEQILADEYPFSVRWQIRKGKHNIHYIATKKDGARSKSRDIEITVVD